MTDPRCEQLDEYLCGWLSPQQAADFEAHLAACPACREQSTLQRQLDRLLAEGTAAIEPVPVVLVRRIERGVRAARRRRLLSWAGAAAAGILLALGLWVAQNIFILRDDGRQIAERPEVSDAVSKEFAQLPKAPPLQSGGVGSAPLVTPVGSEPPATRVRVTLVDPSSAILVPVESHSLDVTVVCVYPTIKMDREDDSRPSQ